MCAKPCQRLASECQESNVGNPPFTDLGDDRFRASGECLTSGDGLISATDRLLT
jgi:hypothetical protein